MLEYDSLSIMAKSCIQFFTKYSSHTVKSQNLSDKLNFTPFIIYLINHTGIQNTCLSLFFHKYQILLLIFS